MQDSKKIRSPMPRTSAWAGVVSMPWIFVVLTVLGLLKPGYSAFSQFGSELDVGWYGAWAERVGVGIFGLLLITFTFGFRKWIATFVSRRRLLLITALFALAGAGDIISGIWTVDVPALHGLGGIMAFLFPTIGQLLTGQKLRSIPGFQKYGRYTYLNGVATLLLDIFSTFYPIFKLVPPLAPMAIALETQYTGLLQRTQIIIGWSWFTVSGALLLRKGHYGINKEISPSKPLSPSLNTFENHFSQGRSILTEEKV